MIYFKIFVNSVNFPWAQNVLIPSDRNLLIPPDQNVLIFLWIIYILDILAHFGTENYKQRFHIAQNFCKYYNFFLSDFWTQNVQYPQVVYYYIFISYFKYIVKHNDLAATICLRHSSKNRILFTRRLYLKFFLLWHFLPIYL